MEITFKAARVADVDYTGSTIGGIAYGNKIDIFTSLAMIPRVTEERPEIEKHRYEQFHGVLPEKTVTNGLLHEMKHYAQRCKGIAMPNSWAAQTMVEHDELPTEREAIEFASQHQAEFEAKLRLEDEDKRFKPLTEWVQGQQDPTYVDVPPFVDTTRVLRTIEDGPESSYSNEYLTGYESLLTQSSRLTHDQLLAFSQRGRELVDLRVFSVYEYNQLMKDFRERLKKVNNPNSGFMNQVYIAATI